MLCAHTIWSALPVCCVRIFHGVSHNIVYRCRSIVTDLPEEDPKISGVEMQYQIGDEIDLNCTSGKSHPPSVLHWYINDKEVSIV